MKQPFARRLIVISSATVCSLVSLTFVVNGLPGPNPMAGVPTHDAIPFLTTRLQHPKTDTGNSFSNASGPDRYGTCSVTRTHLPPMETLANALPLHVPDTIDTVRSVEIMPVDSFWKTVLDRADGKPPILFIHGYHTSFEKACRRAAGLEAGLKVEGRLIFFSWPSSGRPWEYSGDRERVAGSVPSLKRAIEAMVEQFGPGNFHVLAHSMGAWGAVSAALAVQDEGSLEGSIIDRFILAAPDISSKVADEVFSVMAEIARRPVVFVSANDVSLAASRLVNGNERLGRPGDHITDLSRVEVVDVTEWAVRVPGGHLYLYFNEEAQGRLRQQLDAPE